MINGAGKERKGRSGPKIVDPDGLLAKAVSLLLTPHPYTKDLPPSVTGVIQDIIWNHQDTICEEDYLKKRAMLEANPDYQKLPPNLQSLAMDAMSDDYYGW